MAQAVSQEVVSLKLSWHTQSFSSCLLLYKTTSCQTPDDEQVITKIIYTIFTFHSVLTLSRMLKDSKCYIRIIYYNNHKSLHLYNVYYYYLLTRWELTIHLLFNFQHFSIKFLFTDLCTVYNVGEVNITVSLNNLAFMK